MLDALLDLTLLGLMFASAAFVVVQLRRDQRKRSAHEYMKSREHFVATPDMIAWARDALASAAERARYDRGLSVLRKAVPDLRGHHIFWLHERARSGDEVTEEAVPPGVPVPTELLSDPRVQPGLDALIRALQASAPAGSEEVEYRLRAAMAEGSMYARGELGVHLVASADNAKYKEGMQLLEECARSPEGSLDHRFELALELLVSEDASGAARGAVLLLEDAMVHADSAAVLAGLLLLGRNRVPHDPERALDVFLRGAHRRRSGIRLRAKMLRWLGLRQAALDVARDAIESEYHAARPMSRHVLRSDRVEFLRNS
ncbi:MAG TPA: hypothetical protein PLZ79_13305 [Burkholderiales bacterium]|nr:hypothetical protein [Burkholderiales bacterium]